MEDQRQEPPLGGARECEIGIKWETYLKQNLQAWLVSWRSFPGGKESEMTYAFLWEVQLSKIIKSYSSST